MVISSIPLLSLKILGLLNQHDSLLNEPIAVGLGAIPGALSRYYLTVLFSHWLGASFPFGTFFINLSGALLMGFFATLMAKEFAEAYRKIAWTAVYTSPMKRTIATAKPLCDAVGIEMQLRDGLKEIRYGKWEGQTVEFVKEHYGEDYVRWLTEPAWNAPTGGETATEIASRASVVVAEIQKKCPTGNVLIVSHKATIRIILCSLLGIDLGRYRDRINALAGSVSVVKFDVYGPLLEVLGDRSYMNENLRSFRGS